MVTPMYETEFKIGTKGTASSPEDMKTISNVESLNIAWDDGIEEWHPFESKGYVRRHKTSKGCTITMSAKRDGEDEGNNYLASLVHKNGKDCNTKFEIVMTDKSTVKMNCVVNVTSTGGDSTALDVLEVEILSDGLITLEPAPVAASVKADPKSK